METRLELSNIESRSLQFLDGMRGLAALYVVTGHARWLLWEGYSEGFLNHPRQYTQTAKLIVYASFLFRYGHEAVLFFFVLSGFVIHLRYSRKLYQDKEKARFNWRSYVWRRAKRLYPPLMFALVLTWGLDLLGRHLGYPIYFQQTAYPLINQNVVADHSWQTGLGNLAFVMNSYVPVWGTNGPLWSLKFEWWFYMIYPLFWWVTKRSILVASALMTASWVVSFYPAIWPMSLMQDVFSMMLAWWFGVLLSDIFTGRIKLSFSRLSPLSLLILILPFASMNSTVRDILWGIGFSGLIALCFVIQRKASKVITILESLKPLGDMSYSLYVIHFPLIVFMSGYIVSRSQDQQLPMHFGWAVVGIILCLLIAYFIHWVVEVPFVRQRKPSPTVSLPLQANKERIIASFEI